MFKLKLIFISAIFVCVHPMMGVPVPMPKWFKPDLYDLAPYQARATPQVSPNSLFSLSSSVVPGCLVEFAEWVISVFCSAKSQLPS